MAALTAGLQIIFFIQEWFMDILMAIHTGLADIPECPFVLLFMAGKAGCGQVCPTELKPGCIMHLDGVIRPVKAEGGMAIGTVRSAVLPDKLAIMVIGMAVVAMAVFQGPAIPAFMTAGTGYIPVFSHQRVIGPGMVEIIQLFDPVERYFRMALDTVLSELVIMHVPVAGRTISKGNSGKLLHFDPVMLGHLMAFNAFNLRMFSPQPEPGFLMVKS